MIFWTLYTHFLLYMSNPYIVKTSNLFHSYCDNTMTTQMINKNINSKVDSYNAINLIIDIYNSYGLSHVKGDGAEGWC